MRKIAVGFAIAVVAVLAAVGMGLFMVVVGVSDVNLMPSGHQFEQDETAASKAYRFAVPPLDQRRAVNRGEVYPHDCAKEKCVALTFDDGPVRGTAKVLDALKQENVKATFFVLGENVREHPDMLRREIAEGHEIGNHTWDHRDLSRMTTAQIRGEIQRTSALIQRVGGVTPKVMRAPYGASSKRVAKVAEAYGLPQVLWAVDPQDWREHRPAAVAHGVLKDVQPGQIVLMHDIQPGTVKAVPQILRSLKKQGYVFVTVTQLLASRVTVPGGEYREILTVEEAVY
ncbi:hypothetical protein GCM10027589_46340 [Actinocorallia lasiicapitis]